MTIPQTQREQLVAILHEYSEEYSPWAKAYLAQLSKHNPIRRHGSEYTTGGNSEGI